MRVQIKLKKRIHLWRSLLPSPLAKRNQKRSFWGRRGIFLLWSLGCLACTRNAPTVDNPSQIPVYFLSCSDVPLLKVTIEQAEYLLKLDLGASCDLMLPRRVLDQIEEKEYVGVADGGDIQGSQYHNAQFEVLDVQIGRLHVPKAVAIEEDVYFISHGSRPWGKIQKKQLQQQLQHIDGRVGNQLFSASVCFLDLAHSKFCIGASVDEIAQRDSLDGYRQMPFKFYKGLMCIDCKTEYGDKSFVLDTGSHRSVLSKSSLLRPGRTPHAVRMTLDGVGSLRFDLLDFPQQLSEVDGILGMDFFRRYCICIDFQNQWVYLKQHPSFLDKFSF